MRIPSILLLSLVIIFASGCAPEQNAVKNTPQTFSRSTKGSLFVKMQADTYLIKQGDQIDISVWGYPEFNTTSTVKSGGTITIPLVGEIKADGVTKDQFEAQVRSKLAQYVKGDFKVNIAISSLTTQRVAVLGAVVRQDNYPVVGELSIIEMLSAAGGPMPDSDLHHVKIIRRGNLEDPVIVDVEDYMQNGSADALPDVRPGDTVYIPKKENVLRDISEYFRDAVLLFGFFRAFY